MLGQRLVLRDALEIDAVRQVQRCALLAPALLPAQDAGRIEGRALLAALRSLDDVPRLRSTHPGGFVLSAEPLGDYMPIEETTMGRTILQFDKDDLDAAGVPKFDFLGLGGLTVVHASFDSIRARTGRDMELYDLPVDDPKTYDMIGRGETIGTFQIESRAQIQSILQTRPTRLYDIVVQVALIRPGPIQARFVRPYTRRRLGLEEVAYADPRMEPILRRTYGIPIFQEQAMALSMALGGFSAAEADELRRAMGHQRKLPKLHAALERLRGRMEENGVAPDLAARIVEEAMTRDGVMFRGGVELTRVERRGSEKVIHYQEDGRTDTVVADEIRRVAAVTDAGGQFTLEWPWDSYFNHFELVVGVPVRKARKESLVELAREDLRLGEGRYETGTGTFLDLLDARVRAGQAETDLITATYDFYLALVELERATGLQLFPEGVIQ